MNEALEQVRDLVAASHRVVVLTGAGISTDSGIPDFRGPQGLWTQHPKAEKMATLQHYLGDPEVRQQAWQNRLRSAAWEARPNLGHSAIVALQDRGQLHGLITQNVDELHQLAGIRAETVIEVAMPPTTTVTPMPRIATPTMVSTSVNPASRPEPCITSRTGRRCRTWR